MHGCSLGSVLVNAEVDSMGGIVDGGVGVGVKTSPCQAAIEKAQAELRQEYDVREERRRELEFLEKGGNPLDFKFGNAASVSGQSTSLDQINEQFVISEAKGSFALTASPHDDSVESSGRPGAPCLYEPNCADNLLLFDGENKLLEGERSSLRPSRKNNLISSEQSSQFEGSHNAKESEDSAIFRPYARRRSKSSRDGSRGGSRDLKGLISDINNQKDQSIPPKSKLKLASVNGDVVPKDHVFNSRMVTEDMLQDCEKASNRNLPEDKFDVMISKDTNENEHALLSEDGHPGNHIVLASVEGIEELKQAAEAHVLHLPFQTARKVENGKTSCQPNGFCTSKVDRRRTHDEGKISNAILGKKGLDSESSGTQTFVGSDVNNDSDMCTNIRNIDSNGSAVEQTSVIKRKENVVGCELLKHRNQTNTFHSDAIVNNENSPAHQNHSDSDSGVKVEEYMHRRGSVVQNDGMDHLNVEGVQRNDNAISKIDNKEGDVFSDNVSTKKENFCAIGPQGSSEQLDCQISQNASTDKDITAELDSRYCSVQHLKLSDKAREDSILEEAWIIEDKRKRIRELSVCMQPSQIQQKSHWDFVLEEMTWLANDFAQERIWKTTAAAQLCYHIALTSRLRFKEQTEQWKIKMLAHTIAKSVMQFWSMTEVLFKRRDLGINYPNDTIKSKTVDGNEVSKINNSHRKLESNKCLGGQHPGGIVTLGIQSYALRFLKYKSSQNIITLQAEAPKTPDRISDSGNLGVIWEDNLTEESLFYIVPPGAMEAYRKSVESRFVQFEKTGSGTQEEVETSMHETAAEFGSVDNFYDEEEGETSTYSLPGAVVGNKSSKFIQKKQKNMKSYTPRFSEVGVDIHFDHCTNRPEQAAFMGKRPTSLNVGPIAKRMRTANRQRVTSPFGAGVTGTIQTLVKTDASSGDANSFQDDQSTLHGGLQIQKDMEVESIEDFEKQLRFDYAETSFKPKKKKKAKYLGSMLDQGWQMDSTIPNEQRDHFKKRSESHPFESNGSSGYGQYNAKKTKMMKQSLDNTNDNINPVTGSIPLPTASQMSNMSNPSKLIKLLGGRDKGRKLKGLKMSAGQPGAGNPWSLFEDQALVVLVHDMGPNWDLVSDAINSSLIFKCIFRKPKECKERHKILMDRSAGDGADSAEDSGTSPSYSFQLPGIPKGSARQLFQRLQGPMEEETLKCRFEKIIKIGQKHHLQRNQNANENLKQIASVHNSHVVALSQVFPDNLNGILLTPLDLCDATASTPDILPLGYQGSQANGLVISNQGSIAPISPTSSVNSSIQGSSGMVVGNMSSPSGPLNSSVRNGRYGVPRTSSSLPVNEQQRMQQCNHMLSSRNIQQSGLSGPGSLPDRGVRMLTSGNGMGMMGRLNRSMPMSRPGFHGMASTSMMGSGSMISSGVVGMPIPVNMHAGTGSGKGNSLLRHHEALHVVQPGHSPEHARQIMVPELQTQVTQGNSQAISPFNGLSSSFNNPNAQPSFQPYSGHAQQQHQMSQQSHLSSPHQSHNQNPNQVTKSVQQAYAMRLAKERQLQQRYVRQQQQQHYLKQQQQQNQKQQQFAASSGLIPHVQQQSQLSLSSSLQSNSQLQSQTSSQPGSLPPVTPPSLLTPISSQSQQKHHLPQHVIGRTPGASGLTNQAVKQRQRQPQQLQQQQPFQPTSRNHPQQQQHTQSQQQVKLLKGIGRGNIMVNQNRSLDPSNLNGLSITPESQALDKGNQVINVTQGQGIYTGTGSGQNLDQPSKALVSQSSNHSQLPQKLHSDPTSLSLKQLQLTASSPDNGTPGRSPPIPSGCVLSSSHQAVPLAVNASSHQQISNQPQSQQNQSSVQRILQQNNHLHSDSLPSKVQTEPTQVEQQVQPTNNTSQINTTATPQVFTDSANMLTVSSAGSPLWKASEPPSDSNAVTQVGSVVNLPVTGSTGNEPVPLVVGLGLKQLSGSMPSPVLNTGAQWPQQIPVQQSQVQSILPAHQYQPLEEQQKQQHQKQ